MSNHDSKPKLSVSIKDDSFDVELQILEETRFKRYLAVSVFCTALLLTIGAFIYGLLTGEFHGLAAVAIFVEAPVMSILGYYYGKNHGSKE